MGRAQAWFMTLTAAALVGLVLTHPKGWQGLLTSVSTVVQDFANLAQKKR